MNSSDAYEQIIQEVYTTSQNNSLLEGLGRVINATFDTKKNIQDVIAHELPFDQTDTILEIAKENHIDLHDSKAAQEFFEGLVKILKSLPTVDLTLGYAPPYRQLQKFSAWWRKHTHAQILLDITVDKSLIAGAKIGYKGQMKDFSLNKVLDTYLAPEAEKS